MFEEYVDAECAKIFYLRQDDLKMTAYIRTYAEFHIQLANLPVEGGIGCLYPADTGTEADTPNSKVIVGPLVGQLYFSNPSPPLYFGPFKTNQERYLAHINSIMERIEAGEFYQTDPVSAYLVYLELKTLIKGSQVLSKVEENHYLKHPDMKSNQMLFDDEMGLKGVVDWEW